MKPRKNYRSRPKKSGAKRKQRIQSQKKRLITAGCKEEDLKKLNVVEVRELVKTTMKKAAKTARQEKKKAAPKKTAPKKKQEVKKEELKDKAAPKKTKKED